MRLRSVSAIALSTLLISTVSHAQAPTADTDRPTVIRTTTTEVLVDMVVRDKNHHLVNDLRPDEVQLFEDGVPQNVKVFRNVRGEEQLQAEQEDARREALKVGTSAESAAGPGAARPLNTLRQVNFVSVVFAQIAPLNLNFARRAVLEFLKSDDLPNTYVTIYRLDVNLHLVRAYTSDKATLEKAVNAATSGIYVKDGLNLQGTIASGVVATINANIDAANATAVTGNETATSEGIQPNNTLAGIVNDPLWARDAAAQDASVSLGSALIAQAHLETGMRYLGSLVDGMDAMDSLHRLVRSQENLPGRKVVLYLADGIAFPVNRREVVDHLIGYANRAGVTFYTIDTRGLSTEDPMAKSLSDLQRVGADSSEARINPGVAHHEDDDIYLTANGTDQGAMRELAEATGGFAVTSTNQIVEPMQRVMEDIRSHYEMAYHPTSTVYDGHFRKIEVRVKRPKVTVQTRKGYYAVPELNGDPLQPFELVALNAINTYPQPVAFPYQAKLIEFRPRPDAVQCEIAFEVPVSGLKIATDPRTGKAHVHASVVALIHDSKGQIVSKVGHDLERDVSSDPVASTAKDRILYAEGIDLPRGTYEMDAAVTDEEAGKTTVTHSSVTVSPSDLGLSSVELVRRFDPLSGPRNPYNPFELVSGRITPTLDESVASGKPLSLYFVVYPAKVDGQDPKVTLHLFQEGKEVAKKPFVLPKPQPDGSIPVVLQFSPAPGKYDVKVTAEQGTLVAESTRALKVE